MDFNTGSPIPELLRNALNDVLEKRDYSIISIQDGMASESTIRDLLRGSKITEHSKETVHEMVRHATEKCDDLIRSYLRLKSTINRYKTKESAFS